MEINLHDVAEINTAFCHFGATDARPFDFDRLRLTIRSETETLVVNLFVTPELAQNKTIIIRDEIIRDEEPYNGA